MEEHFPALLAYVRLHADPMIRQNESCADVVQSVCREVLEDAASFEYRGIAPFRKWLFQRVLTKLIDRKRFYLGQKRDVRRARPLGELCTQSGLEQLYASICSPSEAAIANEDIARLERAFARLPEDYRQMITMSRLLGMTHAEIAAELGRNEGAVRVLLHRALARLGLVMHADEAGDP